MINKYLMLFNVILSFIFVYNIIALEIDNITQKKIVIVIPSYNNQKWYTKNLDSVFSQNYQNYHVIYVDDTSPDGTGKYVKEYVNTHNLHDNITLIINEKRQGALANLYYAIHSCNDTDIIVTLDGDDWFAHENVLQRINSAYANPNVWLTYGQFKRYPQGSIGWCRQTPKNVVAQNTFRKHKYPPSHLRTFYAALFKKIKIEDLMKDGQFYTMSWDLAMMFPMIEMAKDRFQFISEPLYIYNLANNINDHKVSQRTQKSLADEIRSLPPYQPLETLFN